MPIPDGVTKLTFSGTAASGVEKWACSLYFTGFTKPPADGSLDPAGLDSSTQWSSFVTALRAIITADTSLTSYDVYYYEGGEATAHAQAIVSHPGTATGVVHPLQTAAVMTLRSANATRSGRGRIYLPANGVGMASDHTMSTVTINAAVDALATYLSAVQLTGGVLPVVVSQTRSQTFPIISVDADYIADTQRRRRNKQTSARHTAVVSPD